MLTIGTEIETVLSIIHVRWHRLFSVCIVSISAAEAHAHFCDIRSTTSRYQRRFFEDHKIHIYFTSHGGTSLISGWGVQQVTYPYGATMRMALNIKTTPLF